MVYTQLRRNLAVNSDYLLMFILIYEQLTNEMLSVRQYTKHHTVYSCYHILLSSLNTLFCLHCTPWR